MKSNDMNPHDPKAISRVKSWNANTVDERLGFINRDALVSENITTPMVQYPMGKTLARDMSEGTQEPGWDMHGVPISSTPAVNHWPSWIKPSVNVAPMQSTLTSPGIMSLHFDPVFSSGSEESKAGMQRIFQKRWIALRFDQSMTENFQSGDLHFMTVATMNLDMHIENARRALKLMKIGTKNNVNKFADCRDLLAACGWALNFDDIDDHLNGWIDQFNRIIGILNGIKFFHELAPGEKRWSSLVKEIYKDTPADTRYAQTYVLTPTRFYRPRQIQYQPTPSDAPVPVWALTYNSQDATKRYFFWEWADCHSSYASTQSVQMFSDYLDAIEEDIETIFYDSGLVNILATMRTAPEKIGLNFSEFQYEFMDKDTTDKTEFPFTWDIRMLLAIHNATILDITYTNVPTQTSTDGIGSWVDPATSYFTAFMNPNILNAPNCWLPFANKLCNLPNFQATNADFANALQWCNILQTDISPSNRQFGGENFGIDILTGAHYYAYSSIDGNGNYSPFKPYLRAYRFFQTVIDAPTADTYDVPSTYTWNTSIECDRAMTAFSLAPIRYHIAEYSSPSAQPGEVERIICGVSGDSDVLHKVTGEIVREFHVNFVNNFWGYPTSVPMEGTPNFEFEESKMK